MSLSFECDGCGKTYRVSEQMAGKRITCKDCGARVDIHEDEVIFEEYGRDSSRKRGRKSQRRKNSATPWIVGGVAAGVVGLIGIVAVGAMLMRPSAPAANIPGTQLAMPETPAAAPDGFAPRNAASKPVAP